MSGEPTFYWLTPGTSDPLEITPDCEKDAKGSWLCPTCLCIRPGVKGPIDVQVERPKIEEGPLNFATQTDLGLARRSFLLQLGEVIISRDLRLGRVYGPDGKELEDWCTFFGRRNLVVRGSDDPEDEHDRAGYRICVDCGRVLYYAGGTHYLYPSPPTDAEVHTDYTHILLPDYLFERLVMPKHARIYVVELPILDEPLDGFGVLGPSEPDRSKWGDCHRSKRGYTRLTDSLIRQGNQDVNAMNEGHYRRVFWHFFPDPDTGRIELADELLEAMERSGIEYVFHE